MHDQMTVAHEIRYPWWKYRPWPQEACDRAVAFGTNAKETWDLMTEMQRRGCDPHWPGGLRDSFLTIWHRDPERNGSDDSCGWSYPHLSQKHRKRLKAFAWSEARDPYFIAQSGKTWAGSNSEAEAMYRGLILQVCRVAGVPMTFGEAAKMASLHIQCPDCCPRADILCFQPGYHTNSKSDDREERERHFYGMCCGILKGILASRRPWYRHPRWHIHHWQFQFHPLQRIRRALFDRCEVCHERFSGNEPVMSTCWDTPRPRGLSRLAFWRSNTHIRHEKCLQKPEVARKDAT